MSIMKNNEMTPQELCNNARFLHAYLECSDELQCGVQELLRIVFDEDTTEQEKEMALVTVADILLPNFHNGVLGMDLEESELDAATHVEGFSEVLSQLNAEEDEFAKRLKLHMVDKGLNQSELAARCGVGQPAISNMLNRQCRPQRRTIERLATALGIQPCDLWPEATSLESH